MDFENVVNAMKTIKEECDSQNCGSCPIQEFCDEIFQESPCNWNIPGVLPKRVVLTGENLQKVYRGIIACGCSHCPAKEMCKAGESCETSVRKWLETLQE